MKFTSTAAVATLALASATMAAPAAHKNWYDSYAPSSFEIVLSQYCEINSTDSSQVDMFWGAQDFQFVKTLTVISATTLETETVPITFTGDATGFTSISKKFKGEVCF
jgi:hypothetical protein